MDEIHRKILRENRTYLVQTIEDVDGITDVLLEKQIITNNMNQEIHAEKTKIAQVRKLLDTVPKRGKFAFGTFCNALIKTGHRDIAETLNPELKNSHVTAVPPGPESGAKKTASSNQVSAQSSTITNKSKPTYPTPIQVGHGDIPKKSLPSKDEKKADLPNPAFRAGASSSGAGSQPSTPNDDRYNPVFGGQESGEATPNTPSDEDLPSHFPQPEADWPYKLDMTLSSKAFNVENCSEDEARRQQGDNVEDLLKKLKGLDKYFKEKPDKYRCYLKLLFEGAEFVIKAFIEEELQKNQNIAIEDDALYPSNQMSSKKEIDISALDIKSLARSYQPLFKGKHLNDELNNIIKFQDSCHEAALISLNKNEFIVTCYNPLLGNLSNIIRKIKKNKTKCKEIEQKCKTSTEDSDLYLDELKNQGKHSKSVKDLYEEAKQSMEVLLKEVIIPEISKKNDEIMLTLCVTNKELQRKLKNAVSKASTDIIIGQDDKNDTLTEVVDKFLAEIKKGYGFTSVTFRLGSNTDDPLDAVERNWETCVQTSNKKMALELLDNDELPNRRELNELCAVFGRKSNITFKVCKKVCCFIKESSLHIIDVYASRKAEDLKEEEEIEIKFVVVTENVDEESRKDLEIHIQSRYDTLPIRDHYSEETELPKEGRHDELKGEDLNRIKTCMSQNAESLLKRHTYLTIISGSPFKSVGFGTKHHRIEETPCIVLNVHYKGYIPIDEEPFELEYDGVLTDVREDVFVLYNGTAKERHDNLKAGCQISGERVDSERCWKGTLGGFVVHPDYGPCGISCCHALLTPSELNRLSEKNEINWKRPSLLEGKHDKALDGNIYQPYDNGEGDNNKIGSLVRVRYKSGKMDSLDTDAYGMEVTLFQISKRLPKSSEFPVVKVSGANISPAESNDDSLDYQKVQQQFGKGAVAGFAWLGGKRYSKFGAITGYTTGEPSINCSVSVKELSKWTHKDDQNKFKFRLHNQVSITKNNTDINDILPTDRPAASKERFAYEGDSGALVYRETTDGNLVCVGMVVGGSKKENTCIVTPILPILNELGITGFKDFDSEQLESNVKTLVNDMGDVRQKIDSGFSNISDQLSNMQNSRFPCEII